MVILLCTVHCIQAGVEEAERSKVERQMDLEQRMKAQVKAWQEKLHDIKKDVVAHTKARDREAKEVQKAEVHTNVYTYKCIHVCRVLSGGDLGMVPP